MTGREGKIVLGFDEKFDLFPKMQQLIIVRADPGEQGLHAVSAEARSDIQIIRRAVK